MNEPSPPSRTGQQEQQKRTLAMVVVLIACIGIAVTINRFETTRVHSDLFARWYASRHLITEGRNLYDPRNSTEVGAIAQNPRPTLEASFFYPAHLFLLTGPLALLPFPAANLIWMIVIQSFYMLSLWWFSDHAGWPTGSNGFALLLLASLIFIPEMQHTIFGQFNTIGLFTLVLSFRALQRKQYFAAGAWMLGLTIKPQGTLLAVAFLLGWALFRRERWPLIAGFAAASFGAWAVMQLILPGWVGDFLTQLRGYDDLSYSLLSVMDTIWNPSQIVAVVMVLGSLVLFWHNRLSEPDDPVFMACISLGILISSLVIPLIGMLHAVYFPALAVVLMGSLRKRWPRWVRPTQFALIALYLFGLIGFIYGATDPSRYGLQIELSELSYKIMAPLVLSVIAVRLALPPKQVLTA